MLILGLAVIGLAAVPGASAARLKWATRSLVDRSAPFANPYSFTGISCPSADLCVGIGLDGRVMISHDPGGMRSRWRAVRVDRAQVPDEFGQTPTPAQLTGVSCPSARFCVAVDSAGDALWSTDPAGGFSGWRLERVDTAPHPLSAVSCASVSVCAAVDRSGDVVVSRDADTRRPVWRMRAVDFGERLPSVTLGGYLTAVSCPSVKLCVALDRDGSIFTSADPSAARAHWRSVGLNDRLALALPLSGPAGGLSCPSVRLCVIASGVDVVSSTDPLGGAAAWTAETIGVFPRSFVGIDCHSASLCVAVDSLGYSYVTTDPTGAAAAWTPSAVDRRTSPLAGFSGVACPLQRLCLAVDLSGNVMHTTDPTAGAGAWTLRDLRQGYNTITGLSCPSAALCVGYDDAGNVLISDRPQEGAARWRIYHLDNAGIESLSCVRGPFCFGLNQNGLVLTATDPQGGPRAWQTTPVDPSGPPAAIACASAQFCATVDGNGNAATTSHPTAGVGAWTLQHVDPTTGAECGKYGPGDGCAPGLDSISCPTAGFCAAADSDGAVVASSDTGAGSPWSVNVLDGGAQSQGFTSCASSALCLFYDDYSSALSASGNPGSAHPVWYQIANDPNSIAGISCASLRLCVAVDAAGGVLAPQHPSETRSGWTIATIDPGRTLAVNCSAHGLCIATDPEGNAFTTADPAAGRSAWTGAHIETEPVTAATCPTPGLCVAGDLTGGILTGVRAAGPLRAPPRGASRLTLTRRRSRTPRARPSRSEV